jgi:predicted RNase H-like HicB family nuclease
MRVAVAVRHEGQWFYSSCPLFDVHSQGLSEQESIDNLVEALQLFVETCYGQGTLEKVLLEQGFVPTSSGQDTGDERMVEVPLALIARQHAEARAR